MIQEGLIFITTVWFLYIECLQIKQYKCSSRYWLDLTNFVDLLSSILNISLILLNWTGSENELIKVGAMIAVFFVWYKTFYWMRLYKQQAFLMNLLMKTLDAIVPFTIMSVILLMMFSNMLYIINQSGEESAYINVDVPFLDSVIYMYFLVIGEYNVEQFND